MGTKLQINKDSVYLLIEDHDDCCFELWDVEGKKKSCVKVKISINSWKTMLKEWKKQQKHKK